MASTCRAICERLGRITEKPNYLEEKWCSICRVAYKDLLKCPCCVRPLRTKGRYPEGAKPLLRIAKVTLV